MNKTEREDIAIILATAKTRQGLVDSMLRLFPKLQDDYEAYLEVEGRSEAVTELWNKKMQERLGESWCLKKESKVIGKDVLKEARQEIYGDDYDYLFGKDA